MYLETIIPGKAYSRLGALIFGGGDFGEAASVERAAFFWLALIAICLGCIVNSLALRSFGLAFILVMNRGSVL